MKKGGVKESANAERAGKILAILKRTYPGAKCSLDFKTPLQLIVATILSAQCTDVRVNIVTKTLFKKYRTAADFAGAKQEDLEKEIQSTGFFRNKAKSLRAMAASLIEKHGGKVPETMEELTELAGVGRKTANVVLGNAFGKNVGVVVDTHVSRVSQRLGLTENADPVKIEADLMKVVPQDQWTLWSHLLIWHGRAICQARRPMCSKCPIFDLCPAGKLLIQERKADVAKSGARESGSDLGIAAVIRRDPSAGDSTGKSESNPRGSSRKNRPARRRRTSRSI